MRRHAGLVPVGLLALVVLAVLPHVGAAASYVTRVGTGLFLDGSPYRFTGLNIYNANSNGLCWYAMDGTVLADSLTAIGPGKDAFRAWFFQALATRSGARDWSAFDRTLATASARGLRVIATLSDQYGECGDGGINGFKPREWYTGGYTQTDPGLLVPYRDWVAEVVTRYKDEPTILAWQLMNEAEVTEVLPGGTRAACPQGTNEPADMLKAWGTDVSAAIKAIDANHLVSLGTLGSGQCGAQGPQYQLVHDIPTIDLCEYHDYLPTASMPGDAFNGLQERINQCNALGKPVLVGESGIRPLDVGGTLTARANAFAVKFERQFAAGVAGELVWAWDKDGSLLGNFDVGPGDPVLGVLARAAAVAAQANPGSTERASLDSTGGEGNAASVEFEGSLALSDDGRYLAFESSASNLVAGDGNVGRDIFVRDRATGVTERVSVSSAGDEANSVSDDVAISADGRYVAFSSNASNLVPADTNGLQDVFVHDRLTGATERVSVDSTGAQATGPNRSFQPAISADGRHVAFTSNAPLTPDDGNGDSDVYLHDRLTGATERISVSSTGGDGNGSSSARSISRDGGLVAFTSRASNLVVGDTNGVEDVFVRDRLAAGGTTERVSVDGSGGQANGLSVEPSISSNGRFVSFTSLASNLVAGDTNGAGDIFVRDRLAGTTERVSVDGTGVEGNSDSVDSALSADGRIVVFESFARNLVANDTNLATDILLRDRQAGTTVRVSVSTAGEEGNVPSVEPGVSGDGSVVAFASFASNLVDGDANGASDAFVHQPRLAVQSASETVPPGGTVSTDGADGVTAGDPVATAVTTPTGGLVSIEETPAGQPLPPGFVLLGQQVNISAPAATATTPLTIVFRIDASLLPDGIDETSVQLFRDGVAIGTCTGAPGTAAPDPCVAARGALGAGDIQLTVLTSHASVWAFGARSAYTFTGFFDPVRNPPALNAVRAGGAVSVKFSLGGNQGFEIFAFDSPGSQPIDCRSLASPGAFQPAAGPGKSRLSYDAKRDRYTYVWQTDRSWAGTCRQLVVRFLDGSARRANFKLK